MHLIWAVLRLGRTQFLLLDVLLVAPLHLETGVLEACCCCSHRESGVRRLGARCGDASCVCARAQLRVLAGSC